MRRYIELMSTKNIKENIPETLKILKDISLNCIFKDITFSEYAVLEIALALRQESKNDTVYISEIVKRLKISKPAVSKTLKNLETKGLIRRETDPNNRRKTFVCLTSKGYTVKKNSDDAFYGFFNDICEKVGKNDIIMFNTLARKLSDAIAKELKLIQERRLE